MSPKKLTHAFYRRDDVIQISKELLGKYLCTKWPGQAFTAGKIVETEAYRGYDDKACHASGSRTPRTEIMYHPGGEAYIFLCYGIHHLFNIVTNRQDQADAVLVRAIEPANGLHTMLQRRNKQKSTPKLTAGPGRLTQALGIKTEYTGANLTRSSMWIEDRGDNVNFEEIACSPRIGVDYAGEHAKRPWRFYLPDNRWVSK